MANIKQKKSTNFIAHGSILAITSIVVRMIGLLYRIPMTNIIGNQGNGLYSGAFEIYNIILLISSYSLPLAVSKSVAVRLEKGEMCNAYRVYKAAMGYALTVGILMSVLTFVFADFLAGTVMKSPMSAIALRVLAPTIFIVAVMGVIRGFFQGTGSMIPTSISQVIEQIINAVASVGAAYVLFQYGTGLAEKTGNGDLPYAYGAAGGTTGTFLGALIGLAFLLVVMAAYRKVVKRRIRKEGRVKKESYREIGHILFYTIVPVLLSTAIYNISSVIDQGIFNHSMFSMGMSADEYNSLWGIYSGKYKTLTNVPIAIASAFAASVVPGLVAALQTNRMDTARLKIRLVTKTTMILTIPCAVGFMVLGEPIIRLLFSGYDDAQILAGHLLSVGAISIIFFALSTLTNGILQGLNQMRAPVRHAAISLVVHIGALFFMIYVCKWHIYAVVYANIIFAFLMCLLNNHSIYKITRMKLEFKRTFIIPSIAAAIMGLLTFGLYQLLTFLSGGYSKLVTIICILAAIIFYAVSLLGLKGVTEEELMTFPKGTFLIKLAKKCKLL